MKKLILSLGIIIILGGCFDAQNRNPMVNNSVTINPSKSEVWWRTPYYADNQDDNPWDKHIPLSPPVDEWSNPWKYDDLRKYGVDVLPGYKAPALPPKPSKDKRPSRDKRMF